VPLLAVASHRDNDRRKFFGANMYDRGLATRLHELTAAFYDLEETRMFGGLAYMMYGHICFALWDDYLVIRIGSESANKLVDNDPHARPFDLAGKTMKGWVMIAADALGEDHDLQNYIDIAMIFTSTLPQKTAKQAPKKH
jgi:hypothetical protein